MSQNLKPRRSSVRGETGQALVEFSLVSILFFLLLFSIFDGVRLIQSWVTVQHAAREGARFAITGLTSCDEDTNGGDQIISRDDCIQWVAKHATEGIPGGGDNSAEVSVSYESWDFDNTTKNWLTTGVTGATGKPCDQIEVIVTYRHHFITPIIAALVPSGVDLTGRQRMTNEPWGICADEDGVS